MPNPQEIQLRLVCNESSTLKRGKEILQLALVKTRPGSGYSLGESAIGLPAICAYIASQELNNGDISQVVAQTSSCLNEKVFIKTLNIVRKALSEEDNKTASAGMSYNSLTREYTGSKSSKVIAWMNDTERTLILKEALAPKYDIKSSLVRCAIFFWVIDIVKIPTPSAQIIADHNLSPKQFDALLKLINKTCESLGNKINLEMTALSKKPARSARTANPPGSPPAATAESGLSSRTRSGTASPSKSAMKSRDVEESPSKALTRKRSVAFDRSLPRTPIKKMKLTAKPFQPSASSSSAQDAQGRAAFEAAMSAQTPTKNPILEDTEMNPFTTPTQLTPRQASRRARSPKREVAMDVDSPSESERSPSPTRQPRRFRPIFLDRKQWASRDPRIEREWPAMMEYNKNMADLYGHPFASHRSDFEMQAV